MYGAIIGDLAGSIYEFEQTKHLIPIKINKIIEENSFYSDDTILTIAIIDAILNDKNYDYYLKKYIKKYSDYKPDFSPYFKTAFSKNIIDWSNKNEKGNSIGNGAIMRISPVGYLFNNEKEVVENAILATIPTHNSSQAIECAIIVSLIIYYFKNGLSKEKIYYKLNLNKEYKAFLKFNSTCYETLDNCLYVIFNSNNFVESIEKAVFMGGDTDTNAAIVGAIAESIYGIPDELKKEVNKKIPDEFVKILKKVYSNN